MALRIADNRLLFARDDVYDTITMVSLARENELHAGIEDGKDIILRNANTIACCRAVIEHIDKELYRVRDLIGTDPEDREYKIIRGACDE